MDLDDSINILIVGASNLLGSMIQIEQTAILLSIQLNIIFNIRKTIWQIFEQKHDCIQFSEEYMDSLSPCTVLYFLDLPAYLGENLGFLT